VKSSCCLGYLRTRSMPHGKLCLVNLQVIAFLRFKPGLTVRCIPKGAFTGSVTVDPAISLKRFIEIFGLDYFVRPVAYVRFRHKQRLPQVRIMNGIKCQRTKHCCPILMSALANFGLPNTILSTNTGLNSHAAACLDEFEPQPIHW
jgi:hypothetical protein